MEVKSIHFMGRYLVHFTYETSFTDMWAPSMYETSLSLIRGPQEWNYETQVLMRELSHMPIAHGNSSSWEGSILGDTLYTVNMVTKTLCSQHVHQFPSSNKGYWIQ